MKLPDEKSKLVFISPPSPILHVTRQNIQKFSICHTEKSQVTTLMHPILTEAQSQFRTYRSPRNSKIQTCKRREIQKYSKCRSILRPSMLARPVDPQLRPVTHALSRRTVQAAVRGPLVHAERRGRGCGRAAVAQDGARERRGLQCYSTLLTRRARLWPD